MKPTTARRSQGRQVLGDRLVAKCDSALKRKVARALDYGLGEADVIRLSVERTMDALSSGYLVYQNGKLLEVEKPATASTPPTDTEG